MTTCAPFPWGDQAAVSFWAYAVLLCCLCRMQCFLFSLDKAFATTWSRGSSPCWRCQAHPSLAHKGLTFSRCLNTCQAEEERKHKAADQLRSKGNLHQEHVVEPRENGIQPNEQEWMVVLFLLRASEMHMGMHRTLGQAKLPSVFDVSWFCLTFWQEGS